MVAVEEAQEDPSKDKTIIGTTPSAPRTGLCTSVFHYVSDKSDSNPAAANEMQSERAVGRAATAVLLKGDGDDRRLQIVDDVHPPPLQPDSDKHDEQTALLLESSAVQSGQPEGCAAITAGRQSGGKRKDGGVERPPTLQKLIKSVLKNKSVRRAKSPELDNRELSSSQSEAPLTSNRRTETKLKASKSVPTFTEQQQSFPEIEGMTNGRSSHDFDVSHGHISAGLVAAVASSLPAHPHGSESNINRLDDSSGGMNGLALAKSYNTPLQACRDVMADYQAARGEEKKNKQEPQLPHSYSKSYASSGPHKVQFVETESLRRYISSNEDVAAVGKPSSISPSKSLGGMIKSGSPARKKIKKRLRQVSEASTISATSINSESSAGMSYSFKSPDGGYGWLVVAASFFVNMIADGVTFSFGVMCDELEGEFDSTKAGVGGVVAVFHAVPLLTGPLATWLTDKYGCRRVTIMGSIMASSGFLLASYSHHIALLYLFFGVITGFGLSLCYVAAIIIVAYYFDRRRSFATGISVCGSGVGTFVFAPFTQYLLDTYDGWRGACIVLAGVFLNISVCGMLFRELPWTKELKGRRESSRSLSEMPEIEDLRSALETGDVSMFLESDDEEPRLASSLLTLPTYIKNSSKLPSDVVTLMATNKQTYNYILHNYPDSLIAKSISDYTAERDLDMKKDHDKSESAGVKLARRVSSLLKGPKSILKKAERDELDKIEAACEKGSSAVVGGGINHYLGVSDEPAASEVDVLVQTKATPQLQAEINRMLPKTEIVKGTKRQRQMNQLRELRMRRQSLTCRKRITREMRSCSCPDMLKTVIPESPRETGLHMFKYCSATFLLFCLSNCILYFWYDVPYVCTIQLAESVLNIPSQRSTQIISIIGIFNTVGELMVGWLGDQQWASFYLVYAVCMICCAVSTALMPLIDSYPIILGLSAVYGFCISANYSLTSPILVELVSIERFSSAYGFLLACQGVANLIGPPFAGWLFDWTGQWVLTFGLAGLFIGISGLLLIIIPLMNMLNRIFKSRQTIQL